MEKLLLFLKVYKYKLLVAAFAGEMLVTGFAGTAVNNGGVAEAVEIFSGGMIASEGHENDEETLEAKEPVVEETPAVEKKTPSPSKTPEPIVEEEEDEQEQEVEEKEALKKESTPSPSHTPEPVASQQPDEQPVEEQVVIPSETPKVEEKKEEKKEKKEEPKPSEQPKKEKVWVDPVYETITHPEEVKVAKAIDYVTCKCGQQFYNNGANDPVADYQAHRPVPCDGNHNYYDVAYKDVEIVKPAWTEEVLVSEGYWKEQ